LKKGKKMSEQEEHKEMLNILSENVEIVVGTADDENGKEHTLVGYRIREGKFKDIIYMYTKLGIAEEPNEDGTYNVEYEFQILENKNKVDFVEDSKEAVEFENLLSETALKLVQFSIQQQNEQDNEQE